MQIQKNEEKVTILIEDKDVLDRFLYWLYNSDAAFSEDCEMGGVIEFSQHIKMTTDSSGKTFRLEVKENG